MHAVPVAIIEDVVTELDRAERTYPPFRSPHEGFAILWEEVDELWDEVKRKSPRHADMRKEAVQVAAMALRFLKMLDGGVT